MYRQDGEGVYVVVGLPHLDQRQLEPVRSNRSSARSVQHRRLPLEVFTDHDYESSPASDAAWANRSFKLG